MRPRWRFDLDGENVPIIRTTEMILRSDLEIQLVSEDFDLPPLVAGQLNLRAGTLLMDFDPLAPSLAKGARSRPPFFHITEGPFTDWRFDLKVFGDNFMRVRSPYFKAKLSADLYLGGSFALPELTGSVQVNGGVLHFPGAKFALDDGEAFIEPSQPDVMQLKFTGIAQKSTKVIVMEVSNSLADPHVQFQSTPPMSQADIGEDTSRNGGNTLGGRYELSPNWSLEGEYDVYDAYNANVIWSIYKR